MCSDLHERSGFLQNGFHILYTMKSFDQTLTLERHGDVMVGDESFINGEKLLENISQGEQQDHWTYVLRHGEGIPTNDTCLQFILLNLKMNQLYSCDNSSCQLDIFTQNFFYFINPNSITNETSFPHVIKLLFSIIQVVFPRVLFNGD